MTRQEALAELKKVATSLNTLLATGCSVQNQLGLAYHSALSRKLAETAGYKNAWEFLSQNVKGLTRATLSTYTDAATYWGSAPVPVPAGEPSWDWPMAGSGSRFLEHPGVAAGGPGGGEDLRGL
jgi:hypothetical protein